jgi:hypothetical protein
MSLETTNDLLRDEFALTVTGQIDRILELPAPDDVGDMALIWSNV